MGGDGDPGNSARILGHDEHWKIFVASGFSPGNEQLVISFQRFKHKFKFLCTSWAAWHRLLHVVSLVSTRLSLQKYCQIFIIGCTSVGI